MGEYQPCVRLLLGQVGAVKREEMANVIGGQGASQLCRTLEYDGVGKPDQILVFSLNRFNVPSPTSQLDGDLGVEHLIEEELY